MFCVAENNNDDFENLENKSVFMHYKKNYAFLSI
jgi:hypothetical protein